MAEVQDNFDEFDDFGDDDDDDENNAQISRAGDSVDWLSTADEPDASMEESQIKILPEAKAKEELTRVDRLKSGTGVQKTYSLFQVQEQTKKDRFFKISDLLPNQSYCYHSDGTISLVEMQLTQAHPMYSIFSTSHGLILAPMFHRTDWSMYFILKINVSKDGALEGSWCSPGVHWKYPQGRVVHLSQIPGNVRLVKSGLKIVSGHKKNQNGHVYLQRPSVLAVKEELKKLGIMMNLMPAKFAQQMKVEWNSLSMQSDSAKRRRKEWYKPILLKRPTPGTEAWVKAWKRKAKWFDPRTLVEKYKRREPHRVGMLDGLWHLIKGGVPIQITQNLNTIIATSDALSWSPATGGIVNCTSLQVTNMLFGKVVLSGIISRDWTSIAWSNGNVWIRSPGFPNINNVCASAYLGCSINLRDAAKKLANVIYDPSNRMSSIECRLRLAKENMDSEWNTVCSSNVFANGLFNCVGCPTEYECMKACRVIARKFQRIGYPVRLHGFHIFNITANIDIGFCLQTTKHREYEKLFDLSDRAGPVEVERAFEDKNINLTTSRCRCEGCQGHGAAGRAGQRVNATVKMKIRRSGKLTFSGAKSRDQIYEAFEEEYPNLLRIKDNDHTWRNEIVPEQQCDTAIWSSGQNGAGVSGTWDAGQNVPYKSIQSNDNSNQSYSEHLITSTQPNTTSNISNNSSNSNSSNSNSNSNISNNSISISNSSRSNSNMSTGSGGIIISSNNNSTNNSNNSNNSNNYPNPNTSMYNHNLNYTNTNAYTPIYNQMKQSSDSCLPNQFTSDNCGIRS